MKRLTLALCAALAAGALAPAFASGDDPSSPFYLLPTQSKGTTLHPAGERNADGTPNRNYRQTKSGPDAK